VRSWRKSDCHADTDTVTVTYGLPTLFYYVPFANVRYCAFDATLLGCQLQSLALLQETIALM
jgi:hypothetical protein